MRRPLVTIALALGALACATPSPAAEHAYYTAAQAAAGAKSFAANCAMCHGAKLQGGSCPPLVGASMKGSRSIAGLFTYVSTNMPAGNPGGLSTSAYLSLTAFLLKQNGHPAGRTPLTAASV